MPSPDPHPHLQNPCGLTPNSTHAPCSQDGKLTPENCTVAVLGAGLPLTLLEGADLEPHLAGLDGEEGGDGGGGGGGGGAGGGEGGAEGGARARAARVDPTF